MIIGHWFYGVRKRSRQLFLAIVQAQQQRACLAGLCRMTARSHHHHTIGDLLAVLAARLMWSATPPPPTPLRLYCVLQDHSEVKRPPVTGSAAPQPQFFETVASCRLFKVKCAILMTSSHSSGQASRQRRSNLDEECDVWLHNST